MVNRVLKKQILQKNHRKYKDYLMISVNEVYFEKYSYYFERVIKLFLRGFGFLEKLYGSLCSLIYLGSIKTNEFMPKSFCS